MNKLTSPDTVKKIMRESGLKFNKSLGQNFLTDEGILHEIIHASGIDKSYGVIEIGPGIGTLTQALSENAARVVAIELDRNIAHYLQNAFALHDNVRIICEDALKSDFAKIISDNFADKQVAIVANLPYYITTPLIMKFLENNLQINSITVMVQKEVADRITASPSSPDYGALSVAVQYYCKPKTVVLAPPHCFMPPPKVTSAVICLDVANHVKPAVSEERRFFKVVKAAFGQRRKTLVNALSSVFEMPKEEIRNLIKEMCNNENVRGEALNISQFIQISEKIY